MSYLKWESVSLERGTAWIEASASKSRKAIVVPLNKDALRVLHRRLARDCSYVVSELIIALSQMERGALEERNSTN